MSHRHYGEMSTVSNGRRLWCRMAPARPVGALWTICSFLVGLICIFTLVQPVWFTGHWQAGTVRRTLTLGLFTFCQEVSTTADAVKENVFQCHHHQHLYNLKIPPSLIWQLSVVSYGIGSALFLLTAFSALFSLCCDDSRHNRLVSIAGNVQIISVLSMVVGLILIPGSFGTPMLQSFCGPDAFPYYMGHCGLGWSFGMAIIGTLMALFCPYLAFNTNFQSFRVSPIEIRLPSNNRTSCYQQLSDGKEYFI